MYQPNMLFVNNGTYMFICMYIYVYIYIHIEKQITMIGDKNQDIINAEKESESRGKYRTEHRLCSGVMDNLSKQKR
jgi:hypothetical protein